MPVNPRENLFPSITECVKDAERMQKLDSRTKIVFSDVSFNETLDSLQLYWSSDIKQQNSFVTQFPGEYFSIIVADSIVYTDQGNRLKNKAHVMLNCSSQFLDQMEILMNERDKKLEELKPKMTQ